MTSKKVFFISLFLLIVLMPLVHAHCPLCTAAVGAAAISAKYYGLDLSIIGLLIGAFGISTGLWIGLMLKKQYFRFQLPLVALSSFLLTVIPLLFITNESVYFPVLLIGQSGALLNKVYWVNKMLFGSIVGALFTSAAFYLHTNIKKINGKVLFPFQGVVLTLTLLVLSGFALYIKFRG